MYHTNAAYRAAVDTEAARQVDELYLAGLPDEYRAAVLAERDFNAAMVRLWSREVVTPAEVEAIRASILAMAPEPDA